MELLEKVNQFVWGIPVLVLIVSVGILFTLQTRFFQIRQLPSAIRLFLRRLLNRRNEETGVSSFQALCTALAATVGIGNLAGVAGAIAIGGPGSIFWMWVCAVLGMIIKYAEVTLAVRYRQKNPNGEYVGGPMYMIRNGMGKHWHWLGYIYCFLGVVAAFGVGNATQINTVIDGINSAAAAYGARETLCGNLAMGIVFAVLIGSILLGGMKRIGKLAEMLVPFASVAYLLLCIVLLLLCHERIPQAFRTILVGAFAPEAVSGGIIGSFFQTLRVGASRGVFTNEAGMGTASIAHSAAAVNNPHEQGLMGIMEVFLDTIVICTMTALAILCSGICIPYGSDNGILLTNQAFAHVYGNWVRVAIAAIVCCFAFATVIGWGLYGIRCAQFLFGERAYPYFVALQIGTVVLSAVMRTATVWLLAEIVNGFMCIPNLIALSILFPKLRIAEKHSP